MPKVVPAQAASGGRGRRARALSVSTELSEINVVPLVDVMLVLLIIFMVATPMMQRGLDVNLPVSQRAPQVTDERLFVTVPMAFAADRQVQIDDEFVPVDVLGERMRQAMEGRTDKEVFLRGDEGVTLGQLMEVMDRLREGGVERVGIVSRLPAER